ncbi:MAG: tripartite tricarboxylate transporter TctB family protein [Rhodospirillales bacterium]
MPADAGAPRRATGEALVGLGIAAVGLAVAADTATLPRAPAYAVVGPAVAPYAVAAALVVLGALLTLAARRGRWRADPPETRAPAPRVAWLLGGLAVNAALIGHVGFVLASTMLFAATARGFCSTRPLRDGAIGFALAAAAYLAFARLLGISLGAGWVEGML